MRVSISWLKQLVQVNESVDDLSERLSMAGFEVDDVDDLSARAHGVVVTAESVPALLVDSAHFEENAEALFRAVALGPVIGLSAAEMGSFLDRFDRGAHVKKLMKYYAGRAADAKVMPREWAEDLILG